MVIIMIISVMMVTESNNKEDGDSGSVNGDDCNNNEAGDMSACVDDDNGDYEISDDVNSNSNNSHVNGDDCNNNEADDMGACADDDSNDMYSVMMAIMVIPTKVRMVMILTKATVEILMMNFMVTFTIMPINNPSTSVVMMN